MKIIASSEMVTAVDFKVFFCHLREVWTAKFSSFGIKLVFCDTDTSGTETESAVAVGISWLGSFVTSVPPREK
jgi:hypothetical protein